MISNFSSIFYIIAAVMIFTGTLTAQDVKPLKETERLFCKKLTEVGLSKAFSEFFADGAIIFRPGPIDGREFHLKRENNYKGLFWEPDFAFMSAGNDFGFTGGPWRAMGKITGNDTAWSYGHYFTIWKLIDGRWRALFDGGIDHPKMYEHDYKYQGATFRAEAADKKWKDTTYTAAHIRKLEQEYSELCSAKGEKEAFEKFAADDARLNRSGNFPFSGKEKAVGYLSKNDRKLALNTMGVKPAPAGDIVFVYGTGQSEEDSMKVSYMKIWKQHKNKWQVALDLMLLYKK